MGSRLLCLLLALALVGCAAAPQGSPAPAGQTLTTAVPGNTPTPAEVEETQTSQPGGRLTLRVWLPEQFDPGAGTPAGDLLYARLQAFIAQNPTVQVEVRLKAVEGVGGLLDSLLTASAAAPLALPDLVALPRPLLESAALKGLIYSYDGLTDVMEQDGWYEYARQMARLGESTYGLPFAGDVLALVYRSNVLDEAPADWEETLALGGVLAFPAADPQALFTLAQYQAGGGLIQDEQGRPILETDILVQVLTYYQRGGQSGVMPFWLTQYVTDQQAWEAFRSEAYPLLMTWTSRFLNEAGSLPLEMAPLPTADGAAFTLATGWSWALASPDPTRQELSARLAEFLVADEFLVEWSAAAGYLPPRAPALQAWTDAALRTLADRISRSARLIPAADVLASLGPALEQAAADVLKSLDLPRSAAQRAAEQLSIP